jgi:hypothetical protein
MRHGQEPRKRLYRPNAAFWAVWVVRQGEGFFVAL